MSEAILWFTVAFLPLSIVANIVAVGKERGPLTPAGAAANIFYAILLLGAIVSALLR